MTRPQMIRADTIDLQDPLSPSAQDHSRASTNGKSARHGHGQHQDEALRNAEQDMLDEIARGPLSPDPKKDVYRVEAEDAYNDQDEPADRANGLDNGRIGDYENHTEEDGGEGDIDDQLDDDDDMLDKISSSPSIDDGGCIELYFTFNRLF
ncbi:protein phosphatase regulator [Emydomyces testavorans]|uniref:Protein phosphatase regulator n=1 Tax=Emydomyces testavorans TaxID=2070801 RepID=A0AAF0ILH2_9EURO|nr:protein phosphatase regulator [Emydomyces testavorans]